MHHLIRPALLGFVVMALTVTVLRAVAEEITIYRCTGGQGQLSLRDTPCADGQQQQRVEMVRPRDPPPRTVANAVAASAPVTATAPPPQQVIVIRPPEPVYQCVTPDGERYTSDNPTGNPRWVPLWTLGYPVYPLPGWDGQPGYPPVVPQHPTSSGRQVNRFKFDNVGRPSPEPSRSGPGLRVRPPMVGLGVSPGTWISDQCHRLPQDEVCEHLHDRRWELGRRYNSAMQSDRRLIDAEQRRIDARLATDCGPD